jgi:hypothetical protein
MLIFDDSSHSIVMLDRIDSIDISTYDCDRS